MRLFVATLAALLLSSLALVSADDGVATYARIQTSEGDIIVMLAPEKAPATVENFLQYATDGHYDRTLFHRVVPGFVVQGGGYSRYFTERPTRDPIPYEGDNGLTNRRGTSLWLYSVRRGR